MNKDRMALIVEDNPGWQNVLQRRLRKLGFSVQVAATYQEAMEKLASDTFHLFTVDISLQADDANNRDGIKVLEKLINLGMGLRAVVISGTSPSRALESIEKEYNFYCIFRKREWTPAEFNKVVKKILSNEG